MIEGISNFLLGLFDSIGVFGVLIASMIESFFPPIPSEIVLFTAGFYARSSGGIPLLLLFAILGAIGNFIGTLPFYLVSRFGSNRYLERFLDRWGMFLLISNDDIKKAEKYFDKRGAITVFFSKLIPGIRSLIAFPAGVSKMNFVKYTVFSLSGSFIWNLILGLIGFAAYDQKDQVIALLKPVENVVLVLIAAAVVLYVIKIVYNYRKIKNSK